MTTWETAWVIVSVVGAFVGGRSVLIWGTLTYLMGWPVVIALVAFGMKPKTWERRGERLQSFLDKIEAMSKPEEYKDFDTVNDLFKQLETPRG
jgi:hypothetical protein